MLFIRVEKKKFDYSFGNIKYLKPDNQCLKIGFVTLILPLLLIHRNTNQTMDSKNSNDNFKPVIKQLALFVGVAIVAYIIATVVINL